MATWRVTHTDVPDGWNVKKSGRNLKTGLPKKQDAINVARARAAVGDTLKVERMNGTVQKSVEITSSNEDRLDMNRGNFSIF